MLPPETAQKQLEERKHPPLNDFAFLPYTPAFSTLGRLICNTYDYQDRPEVKTVYQKYFSKDKNPWRSLEGRRLAKQIFGPQKNGLAAEVWDLMDRLPYQNGYDRRPYRSEKKGRAFAKKVQLFSQLYQYGLQGTRDLDLATTARYDVYCQWGSSPAYLWLAAGLDREAADGPLFTLLDDIIQGEDEIGGTTRAIINALLITKHSEAWKLVEKLLLAAQRQEGLRQSILESVDECSVGAFRHFIGVIREHKLFRFSSVVRAVDTWFGFGWEAPKKNTINRVLSLAEACLDDEDRVVAALGSQDNLEVYVALWSRSVSEVEEAVCQAAEVLYVAPRPQKLVACYFLMQTSMSHLRVDAWAQENFGQDLELDYWVSLNLTSKATFTDQLFRGMLAHAAQLPTDGKLFPAGVFSWLQPKITPAYFYNFIIARASQEQLIELSSDISKIPSDSRETYFRKLFPKHGSYSLRWGNNGKKTPKLRLKKDDWKRNLIHQGLSDRNSSVQATSLNALRSISLTEAEYALIVDLLRRKGKHFRSALLKIVLVQKTSTLQRLADELLVAGNVDQRLAGLEILTILHAEKRLPAYVREQVSTYRERGRIAKNEQVLLDKFGAAPAEFTLANGFGVINPAKLTAPLEPTLQFTQNQGSILKKLLPGKGDFLFGNFIDADKIATALRDLMSRLQQYKNYEYTGYYGNGDKETYLLGNVILPTVNTKEFSADEKLDALPKAEVWKEWYEQAGLNDFELVHALNYANDHRQPFGAYPPFKSFFRQYVPAVKNHQLSKSQRYDNPNRLLAIILEHFYTAKADKTTLLKFHLDVLEDACARLPRSLRSTQRITYRTIYDFVQTEKIHWSNPLRRVLRLNQEVNDPAWIDAQDPVDMLRLWKLQQYLFAARTTDAVSPPATQKLLYPQLREQYQNPPTPWLTLILHHKGLLSDADLLAQALFNEQLITLAEGGSQYPQVAEHYRNLLPKTTFAPLKKNLLKLELGRGEMATEASPYVNALQYVEGARYLTDLVERLGSTTLERGYSWSQDHTRKSIFSALIKKSRPVETDTLADFITRARATKLSKKRWLEIAMYAPQWADWIGEYLRIKELESAVWWFHAHATDYSSKDKQAIVARFSPIEHQDFRDGAIDLHWFHEAYGATGKANWKLLHDAAKYVTDGNGHRQVKTYSAVMLGEIKITESLKRVTEKRDKVHVKALGLIPLSRRAPRKDVLKRYNLLQEFRRQAKQFGAQRQTSEQLAVDIGLDNLARNAGYADTVQFGWVMEGEATRAIMKTASILLDEVEIELRIDGQGRADIHVVKNGKPQKSIPAKYRKHKLVKTLKENKALLRKQYQRTRASLENAMVSVRRFTAEEMTEIFAHPIVRAMLSKLVLFAPERGIAGFWADGRLQSVDGSLHTLADADELLIAHPAHLYRLVEWDRYQAYAFDQQLIQPFKQIFRELYLVTKDEREEKYKSSRYQGHQIQPQKTAALLRSRGWVAERDEGLQKVFHQKDIIATLYAMADWYSPADVEAPVLEHVAFYSRKNYQHLPLEDIDPVLFSEVMRDVDLVVSVAHVGQVDPEASHSSLEMRAALARESARLFKLDNVEVKERHLIVTGKLGAYAIHLGSGKVSRDGLQLSIIPVHSQHRGRIFLPFIDDDPKSAEIISKMRMLAKDDKIQDPTVLAQIVR